VKVWFTALGEDDPQSPNHGLAARMAAELRQAPQDAGCKLTDSPAHADVIVYWERGYRRGTRYAKALLAQEAIRKYPNRCFVVDDIDLPIGYLPGVYTAMPRRRMDNFRFRTGSYIDDYNDFCARLADRRHEEPRLLFSFRGAASSDLRKTLLAAGLAGPNFVVQQSFGWFDHSDEKKKAYVDEILDSKFVLCPRGIATTSIRQFEVMQMGRVPVILSDDWVAPEGPPWLDCSVRVSESRIQELPQILSGYEPHAREMGRQARDAWERWFSPETRNASRLRYIEDILLQRPANHDESLYHRRWLSWSFAWKYQRTPLQRLARNARQRWLLKDA